MFLCRRDPIPGLKKIYPLWRRKSVEPPMNKPTPSGKQAAIRSVPGPRPTNQFFMRSARSGEITAVAIPAMKITRPMTRTVFGVRVAVAAKKSNPPRRSRPAATTYDPVRENE